MPILFNFSEVIQIKKFICSVTMPLKSRAIKSTIVSKYAILQEKTYQKNRSRTRMGIVKNKNLCYKFFEGLTI